METQDQPLIFLHLKLVSKISLGVGTVAVLALLVSLLLLPAPVEESYEAIIRSKSASREQLGALMLVLGLALVAVAAIVTWLITLYSSFRVAGPLFRFSQNLKLAGTDDQAELIGLRHGDSLHEQQALIREAVGAVRAHLGEVEQVATQALAALDAGDAPAYSKAVSRLRVLNDKVRT